MQEAIGLQAVTDGEYRRAFWHFDFLAGLEGVELVEVATGIQFSGGAQVRPVALAGLNLCAFCHPRKWSSWVW